MGLLDTTSAMGLPEPVSDDTREARTLPLRGFARLTVEERRAVSSKGGKAVQDAGTAHRWTPEEAREHGKRAAIERGETDATAPSTSRES